MKRSEPFDIVRNRANRAGAAQGGNGSVMHRRVKRGASIFEHRHGKIPPQRVPYGGGDAAICYDPADGEVFNLQPPQQRLDARRCAARAQRGSAGQRVQPRAPSCDR